MNKYSSPSFNNNYIPQDTEPCSTCKYKVAKCDARNGLLCKQICIEHHFSSTVTGRRYHIRTTKDLDCDSSNLIYLLQCNNCSLQYIGEMVQTLKERIRQHQSAWEEVPRESGV